MVAFSRLIYVCFIVFISVLVSYSIVAIASAPKYNTKKEYVVDANVDNLLEVLHDYDLYPKLFDNIVRVHVHEKTPIREVVEFEIKVLRKQFKAVLEFREYKNYGRTTYRIGCNPIELYNMDELYGNLYLTKLSDKKTKITVEANIKPSVFLPEFILENIINRSIDEAIDNLEKLVKNKMS